MIVGGERHPIINLCPPQLPKEVSTPAHMHTRMHECTHACTHTLQKCKGSPKFRPLDYKVSLDHTIKVESQGENELDGISE